MNVLVSRPNGRMVHQQDQRLPKRYRQLLRASHNGRMVHQQDQRQPNS